MDLREALLRHLRDATSCDPSQASNVAEAISNVCQGWPEDELLDFADSVIAREAGDPCSLHYADLAFAWRCRDGSARAVRELEQRFAAELSKVRARFRLDDASHQELMQRLREKLFVAQPPARPRILEYSGRSELLSWLRVILTRLAIDLDRAARRTTERPEGELMSLVWGEAAGPEVELLKAKYSHELREALLTVSASLSPEDRNALRAHYVHHMTVDQMAPAFGIHRATAARRIAKARAALVSGTRATLQGRLDISTDTLDSLLGLIQSGFDVSLSRILGES
jgi:RNA polymerase sigma-70 factor, ECF subfamily